MRGKLLIGAAFLMAAVPAFAHHSIVAEFDPNQPIEFKGAVKKIEWTKWLCSPSRTSSISSYSQAGAAAELAQGKISRLISGAPASR